MGRHAAYGMAVKRIGPAFKRHIAGFVLTAAGITGAWFRVWNLAPSVWSLWYDTARDMLVVRHIVEFGEIAFRGPPSEYTRGVVMNSPLYYYLLSVFWWMTRDPIRMSFLWSGIMTLGIPVMYRIGARIGDRWLGILFAALTSVNILLVFGARTVWQPNILPIWSMLFLLAMLYPGKQSGTRLTLGAIFLFVPVLLHYSSLIIVPVGFLWITYEAFALAKRTGQRWVIGIPFGAALYAGIWLVVTAFGTSVTEPLLFFGGRLGAGVSSVLLLYRRIHAYLLLSFWQVDAVPATYGASLAAMAAVIWHFRRERVLGHRMAWVVAIAFSAPIGIALSGTDYDFYALPVIPFYIVIYGTALWILIRVHRVAGALLAVTVCAYLGFQTYVLVSSNIPRVSYVNEARRVADRIRQDERLPLAYDGREPDDASFVLAVYSVDPHLPYDGWATGGFWYYLERAYGKRLVRIVPYGVSFVPLRTDPRLFYMVCDHGSAPGRDDICIRNFLAGRPYVSPAYARVYDSGLYGVYRFVITGKLKPGEEFNRYITWSR